MQVAGEQTQEEKANSNIFTSLTSENIENACYTNSKKGFSYLLNGEGTTEEMEDSEECQTLEEVKHTFNQLVEALAVLVQGEAETAVVATTATAYPSIDVSVGGWPTTVGKLPEEKEKLLCGNSQSRLEDHMQKSFFMLISVGMDKISNFGGTGLSASE